mmetsp:Transcript_60596/g.138497  ORF Transcript_60596/g.138497 Transcript_60596/m.138497 type:complete len:215 (-) Transcript_60596:877-1521(-)
MRGERPSSQAGTAPGPRAARRLGVPARSGGACCRKGPSREGRRILAASHPGEHIGVACRVCAGDRRVGAGRQAVGPACLDPILRGSVVLPAVHVGHVQRVGGLHGPPPGAARRRTPPQRVRPRWDPEPRPLSALAHLRLRVVLRRRDQDPRRPRVDRRAHVIRRSLGLAAKHVLAPDDRAPPRNHRPGAVHVGGAESVAGHAFDGRAGRQVLHG